MHLLGRNSGIPESFLIFFSFINIVPSTLYFFRFIANYLFVSQNTCYHTYSNLFFCFNKNLGVFEIDVCSPATILTRFQQY